MKRKMAALILATVCHGAFAVTPITGNEIKPFCNGDEMQKMICAFWADGVEQGFLLMAGGKAIHPDYAKLLGYCAFETGVTRKQKAEIFTKFLNDNPEKLHIMASVLFYNAMKQAFPLPCN